MFGRASATGAQEDTRRLALRAWLSKRSRAALSRRAGRIRLFPAVVIALLAGLGVAFVAYRVLRWITPVDPSKAATEIDVTRVALTIVAGVGGVVALVIAYRRQRDIEQSRFVERFGAAAAQLGATDVAVRLAGVYAMAGVADESEGLRRQQCIDVLCGYLRLPYSPELGANHQSKLVLKQHRATADGTRSDDQEHHLEFRHNDREARATIIRVIADHLRPTAEYSWSASDFDFRTAHLEDVDFKDATFSGAARFGGATFSGETWFRNATFANDAWFDGVTFSDRAWFNGVTFFGSVEFGAATFSGDTLFHGTTVSGSVWFGAATFSGDVDFGGTAFSDSAWFDGTTFSGNAGFHAATFADDAWFRGATFSGPAGFGGAIFSGNAGFDGATFADDARFRAATFSSDVDFGRTAFSDSAWFDDATFSGNAGFRAATFSGPVVFDGATFAGDAWFARVDFGSGPVSFAGPKQWGPPAPVFDWDQDISLKPANVEPQEWPPAVVPNL
ncbi:pentapeptide repeat-containing protein [Nocardia asteroides]|uniref:pentapeptide repeat-containing protein n=1 Tax=Nocardia asteroides TaxID=1824 RepID=UPI00340F2E14